MTNTVVAPWIPPNFTDHLFATKFGVELWLRIWRADVPSGTRAPWLLWSHGGAFIGCSHHNPMPWVFPGFLSRGVHVVSYAYRLAPQASVYDMIEDGRDALAWCRLNLASIVGDVNIERYFVGGESAGGCMASYNGFLSPPPRAVVNVYGAVDHASTFFDEPPTPPSWKPALSGEYSTQEIERAMVDRDLSHAVSEAPNIIMRYPGPIDAALAAWRIESRTPDYNWTDRMTLQNDIMVYAGSTSRIVRLLTRREYYADDKTWRAAVYDASPLGRIDALPPGSKAYPPTFFLHGEADIQVPIDNSLKMAAKLRERGVEVQEAYEPGMDHVFDLKYTGPDVPGWDTYIEPLAQFVFRHLDHTAQ